MNPGIIDGTIFTQQTILLADDNEDDVIIMQRAFQKQSVLNPLQVVNDGEQAIHYLAGVGIYSDRRQYPLPVIILLDLSMPKKGGLEVLEWLRQQPSLTGIAVHILTASTRSADVARAFELKANAYIVKPSRIEALTEIRPE